MLKYSACLALLVAAVLGLSSQSQQPAVTESSPAWAKLAAIHAKSTTPPAAVLDRFQEAFTRLSRVCPDSEQHIAEIIVAGQKSLTGRSASMTLLDLTEGVVKMFDSAEQSGGIPKMKSCSEPVAILVMGLNGRK